MIENRLFLRIIAPKAFKIHKKTGETYFDEDEVDEDDIKDAYRKLLACCTKDEFERLEKLDLKLGYNTTDGVEDKIEYFKNLPLQMRREFVLNLKQNKMKDDSNFQAFMKAIDAV